MNIGNITSNNMNLTENGRFMQIEIYEKEIERLNNIIEKLEQENAVLKTLVVNKDSYTYSVK